MNWIQNKLCNWLGVSQELIRIKSTINTLTKEVNYDFSQINTLKKYMCDENDVEELVRIECEKHAITDADHIKQLIKSQKTANRKKIVL